MGSSWKEWRVAERTTGGIWDKERKRLIALSCGLIRKTSRWKHRGKKHKTEVLLVTDIICTSLDYPDLPVEHLYKSKRRLVLTTAIFCHINCPEITSALSSPRKVGPVLFCSRAFSLAHRSSARGQFGDERLPLQAKSVTLPKKPEAHGQGNRDDPGGPCADFA